MDPTQRFRLLALAALADGRLDDPERAVLHACARRLRLPDAEVGRALEEVTSGAPLRLAPPGGSDEREALLREMIDVVLVDGAMDWREQTVLGRVARALGVSPERLPALVREAQDEAAPPGPVRAALPPRSVAWRAVAFLLAAACSGGALASAFLLWLVSGGVIWAGPKHPEWFLAVVPAFAVHFLVVPLWGLHLLSASDRHRTAHSACVVAGAFVAAWAGASAVRWSGLVPVDWRDGDVFGTLLVPVLMAVQPLLALGLALLGAGTKRAGPPAP